MWIDPRPLPTELASLYPEGYYTRTPTVGRPRSGWRNLAALADLGWSVVGQDIDPLAVTAARERGIDARCGELADLADELGSRLPPRVRWAIGRVAGVVTQAAAATIRADARGVGDDLRAVAFVSAPPRRR